MKKLLLTISAFICINAVYSQYFQLVGGTNTGANMMYNAPTGNILMATGGYSTPPLQKLHIAGGNILLSSNGGNYKGNIYFGLNGINPRWGIEYYDLQGSGGLNFWNLSSKNFALFIQNNGNVGIGTHSPTANLHIKSDDKEDAAIIIETSLNEKYAGLYFKKGIGTISSDLLQPLVFCTDANNVPRMIIDSKGNVGIGTDKPFTMLTVNGHSDILSGQFHEGLLVGDDMTNAQLTVSSLRTVSGKRLVITDEAGTLSYTDDLTGIPGDNLGNHTATNNLNIGDFGIFNGSGVTATDAGTINGFYLTDINNAYLANNRDCHFQVLAGTYMKSGLWVSRWNSGGYGLVLDATVEGQPATGGIYCDMNDPKAIMNFHCENIGIGIIPSPTSEYRLTVSGGLLADKVGIGVTPPQTSNYNLFVTGGILTDKVGIGCTPPETSNYKLFVTGGIETEEILVRLQGEWKDYVFNKDYKLKSLNEVEKFIQENNHLPDVPSANEVKENGIELGEMNSVLLQKIEELTLYIIEQQKEIELLKEKVFNEN